MFIFESLTIKSVAMTKDINKDLFAEETKLKLNIFRDCFKEWIPVFVHNPYVKGIYIYDFFAGSGKDIEGTYGSPLILLDEIKGKDNDYCCSIKDSGKIIHCVFNEYIAKKSSELQYNINLYLNECKSKCSIDECIYENKCHFPNRDFKDLVGSENFRKILANDSFAKFILLDQYGFKNVDKDVFQLLVDSPKTDFIFFIATSFISRFIKLPAVTAYFDKEKINFDRTKGRECHRTIANYFRSLIPVNKEYYLHHFTIRKGSNYYGLIFGSNHTYGMEKFLDVCWKQDKFSGEANIDLEGDYEEGTLFYQQGESNKKQRIKKELMSAILKGEITDNISGMKYVMTKGCQPKLFVETISQLIKEGIVIVTEGNENRKRTAIHTIKNEYIYKFTRAR